MAFIQLEDMRVITIDIPNCFVIEEGNRKLTLFHFDAPIAHIINRVCFASPSCFEEGSSDKAVFDNFHPRYLEGRSMFGREGIIIKTDRICEQLTINFK
jgi:hypothetical protein